MLIEITGPMKGPSCLGSVHQRQAKEANGPVTSPLSAMSSAWFDISLPSSNLVRKHVFGMQRASNKCDPHT